MDDIFRDHCSKVIQDIILDYKDQLELTDQLEKKEGEYVMCVRVLNGEYKTNAYYDGNIITASYKIFSYMWECHDEMIKDINKLKLVIYSKW